MFGVDEVVGHGLIDGHGHGPRPVGCVATVDGDRLVAHGIQALLFGMVASRLAYSRWAALCHGQGARAPSSSKGKAATKAGSRSPPITRTCSRRSRSQSLPIAQSF